MAISSETAGVVYCPACGSGLAPQASQCASCLAAISIEFSILRVPDPRTAYRAAASIFAFEPKAAPRARDIQQALQAGSFRFQTKGSWDASLALVHALGATGVVAAIAYRAEGGKKKTDAVAQTPAKLVSLVLFLLFVVGAVSYFLGSEGPGQGAVVAGPDAVESLPIAVNAMPDGEPVVIVTPQRNPAPSRTQEIVPEIAKQRLRFDQIGRSIVVISTDRGALGSGFVVAGGQIVTNRHVLRGLWTGSTVYLQFIAEDGTAAKTTGRVAAVGRRLDLAVVTCGGDCEKLPALPLGRAADANVGETVFALGNPLGLSFSLSKGILSNNARALDDLLFVQADIAINPGNSGGPLFNERGEVIGIVTAKSAMGEGIGFALPIEYAIQGGDPVLQDIVATESDFSAGMLAMMERAGVRPGTERVSGGVQQTEDAPAQVVRLVGAFAPSQNPGNQYYVRFLVGKQVGEVSGANARYYLMLEQRNGYRGVFPLTNLQPARFDNDTGTVAYYAFEQQGQLEGAPKIGPGDKVTIRMNDHVMSNQVFVQDVR